MAYCQKFILAKIKNYILIIQESDKKFINIFVCKYY